MPVDIKALGLELGIKMYTTEAALLDNRHDVQSTAHSVLQANYINL